MYYVLRMFAFSFKNVECNDKRGCVFVENPANYSLQNDNVTVGDGESTVAMIKKIFNLHSKNIAVERQADNLYVKVLV